jgi:hypothetical protein
MVYVSRLTVIKQAKAFGKSATFEATSKILFIMAFKNKSFAHTTTTTLRNLPDPVCLLYGSLAV